MINVMINVQAERIDTGNIPDRVFLDLLASRKQGKIIDRVAIMSTIF